MKINKLRCSQVAHFDASITKGKNIMKTTYNFKATKKNGEQVADSEYIAHILNTAGGITQGEETITEFLVAVSKNKEKRKSYIDTLNHNNETLVKEELKAFKDKVHKMVKLTNKKATQEAILGKEKAKEQKWCIRLAKSKDVENNLAKEAEKGKYKEFLLDIEPTPEKEEKSLVEIIGDWIEANEKGLAEEGRKIYEEQMKEASQQLNTYVMKF